MLLIIFCIEIEFDRLKAKDPEAFEKFYKKYKNEIYTYLLYKTNGNKEITKEIHSETFLKALKSITKLKNNDNLLGWLYRIAKNSYFDYIKKKRRIDTKVDSNIEIENISTNDCIDEDIQKKQRQLMFNFAIDRIKDKYRNILELKYMKEKSQKEIAKIFNKSESSIESLLYRAREALKKEFKKVSKDYFDE